MPTPSACGSLPSFHFAAVCPSGGTHARGPPRLFHAILRLQHRVSCNNPSPPPGLYMPPTTAWQPRGQIARRASPFQVLCTPGSGSWLPAKRLWNGCLHCLLSRPRPQQYQR
ncbi:hypothetical protein B0H14DRAFT_3421946 [Mycena olivaceomarginata]|nr:hypothetical protein B0H14DRAFT_3432023 [Mycena olivaceomarginata]KAJ7903769.1 hypothetical protein B0H14DRAFT_3421946 [Mycena olivaceomarginata]